MLYDVIHHIDKCVPFGPRWPFCRFCDRVQEHRGYITQKKLNHPVGSHFNKRGHSVADIQPLAIERVLPQDDHLLRRRRERLWINKYDAIDFGANTRDWQISFKLLLIAILFKKVGDCTENAHCNHCTHTHGYEITVKLLITVKLYGRRYVTVSTVYHTNFSLQLCLFYWLWLCFINSAEEAHRGRNRSRIYNVFQIWSLSTQSDLW